MTFWPQCPVAAHRPRTVIAPPKPRSDGHDVFDGRPLSPLRLDTALLVVTAATTVACCTPREQRRPRHVLLVTFFLFNCGRAPVRRRGLHLAFARAALSRVASGESHRENPRQCQYPHHTLPHGQRHTERRNE